MHGLVVDFAGLRSLATGIDKRIEETDRILSDLGQQVRALTQGWEGAASEGFRQTQDGWFAAADDLRGRLAELRELIVVAHDNHAGAVRGNVAIWRV